MEFDLFETLYGSREAGFRWLNAHLARLSASARELGFVHDPEAIRTEALRCEANLIQDGPHRVRIRLERSGGFEICTYPLEPSQSDQVTFLLGTDWGFAPQCSSNLFLRHKSSMRQEYDRGWKFAETQGAFDLLFINERGELTEGGRTNLFLQIEDKWWTPPLASGVLPGIMRAMLLKDVRLGAREKVLFIDDLLRAEQALLCNSLRGSMNAKLVSRS